MAVDLRVLTEADWKLWRVLRRRALADAPYAFYSTLAEWTGEGDTEDRWRRRLRAVPYNVVAYIGGGASLGGEGASLGAGRFDGEGPLGDGASLDGEARFGGEAAGMVSATDPVDGDMVLLSLWVAPVARGQGVGDALVSAVLRRAASVGAARVTLDVREGNDAALALYLRHGFIDAGPTPELKPGDPPERRMVRLL